jgi:hypothetical protein
MPCFYCGKPVSVIRKLTDPDFCCDEHRERYHELARLAIQRLMEASPTARKPREAQATEAVAAPKPEAPAAETPRREAERQERIPAPAGLRDLAWIQNKDVPSCFYGAAASGFTARISLPQTGWGVKSATGLAQAAYAAIRLPAARANGAGIELHAHAFAGRSLDYPKGPSPGMPSAPREAGLTIVEARPARWAGAASPAGGTTWAVPPLQLPAIGTPRPHGAAGIGMAPAMISLPQPAATTRPAAGRSRTLALGSAHLSMPQTTVSSVRYQALASTTAVEPLMQSLAYGQPRTAIAQRLIPALAWPATGAAVPSPAAVRTSESLILSPSPVKPVAGAVCAAQPIVVRPIGVQRELSSLRIEAAIPPVGVISIPARPVSGKVAPAQARVGALAPRLVFPQALPQAHRGLTVPHWFRPEVPPPASLVSLGVGSGAALTVSVALPAMAMRLPELPAEPAKAPPATVPAPGVKALPAAPAPSGATFPAPPVDLSACVSAGPAVATSLSVGTPSMPEPRAVLSAPEAQLVGEPHSLGLAGPVAPCREARTLTVGDLPSPPAISPAIAVAGAGLLARPVVAGPVPSVSAACVPRVEAEPRVALAAAGCLDLELRRPARPEAIGATASHWKALPVAVCYPRSSVPAAVAGIGLAEQKGPDLLRPQVAKPASSGRSADWLAAALELRLGASRLGIGTPAVEACAALPLVAAGPAQIRAVSQGPGDPLVGVRPARPHPMVVPEGRARLGGLQDLKVVAPRAARPELTEKTPADLTPAPPRAVVPHTGLTPRVAHSFARYPVREVGPKPKAGAAPARHLSLEPLWQTRGKRPAGVVSLITVEFELPPTPPIWRQLFNVWRGLPTALRAAVASVALVIGLGLLIWAVAGEAIANKLEQRAAIELHEDFSQGLRAWIGAAGWSETWKRQPGGYVEIGQLALWRPTRKLTDYQFEFLGQVSGKTLGWVYRASDPDNYYSMKLTVVKPGPLPTVMLVRSVVVAGREQEKVQVPVRVRIHQGSPVRVRVQVRGDGFTTWIADQLTDFWRDERFRQGAIGFFADPGDRAQLFWVRLAHQNDFLGKLCSYLAPSQREEYGP